MNPFDRPLVLRLSTTLVVGVILSCLLYAGTVDAEEGANEKDTDKLSQDSPSQISDPSSLDGSISADSTPRGIPSSLPTIQSDTQRKATAIYESAMTVLNDTSRSDRTRAYHILEQAAHLNHTAAKRMVAIAYLFGSNGMPFRPGVAKHYFEQLAEEGDAESRLYLGFMHSFGLETPPSQAKALVSYTFAAIGGSHLAQMALGYRLYAGVSVLQNCEAALDHYRRVAKIVEQSSTGQSPSGTTVRIRLSDEYENPSKSSSNQLDDDLYQYYQFLADKGDVQAQVGLGHLHYQGGRGVQQDHTRALNYFKQAAQTGNANAMAYLGKMFLEGGKTVPQNNESAFKYFQMAADKGSSVGQAGLGMMFLYGKGVSKDYEKALKFLTLAANQGLVDGQLELGNMFYNGLGVEKNYKLALKYYKLASKQGHALAFYYLAMMHARGIGTPRSCVNAVDGFKVREFHHWL